MSFATASALPTAKDKTNEPINCGQYQQGSPASYVACHCLPRAVATPRHSVPWLTLSVVAPAEPFAYNSCLMGKFRNGELATGLGRQSSVFQMVRRRSACLLLSITTVVRRDRPTGDRAPGRHKVFAACRRGSDAGNLRPPKSACAVDPDEKLEAIEACSAETTL